MLEGGVRSSEIALCASVIQQEASELGISKRSWAVRLLIHGALHTEGYGHDTESARRRMERMERKILQACGYDPSMVPVS